MVISECSSNSETRAANPFSLQNQLEILLVNLPTLVKVVGHCQSHFCLCCSQLPESNLCWVRLGWSFIWVLTTTYALTRFLKHFRVSQVQRETEFAIHVSVDLQELYHFSAPEKEVDLTLVEMRCKQEERSCQSSSQEPSCRQTKSRMG